jgi:outer membrane receptor protein involved in Fe transport
VAGTDIRHHTFRRSAVEEKTQLTAGGYGIFESRWNNQFSTMASLRYDKVQDVQGVLSPKVSAIFRPIPKLAIRASAGRGFHAPTVQELYEEGYGHSGRAYRFGNPELKPEYATTFNLSAEYEATEKLMVYGNGFFNIVDNMIVPVYQGVWEQDSAIDVWMRQNIQQAHIYGAELNARWEFVRGHMLEGGHTYTESRDDSEREVYYQPGSSSYVRYRISQPVGSRFLLQGFVGFMAETDRSTWNWKPAEGTETGNTEGMTTELADYTRLDAGLGFVYDERFSLMLKVDNILGEDIEYLEDAFTQIQGEPFWRVKLGYTFAEE